MGYHIDDTIAAVATASGGAARGMVRISGPDAVQVVDRCFSPKDRKRLGESRHAMAVPGQVRIALGNHTMNAGGGRGRSASPCTGDLGRATHAIPCDLCIWPNNRSYTRQPLAELHTFGSLPVMAAVLEAVCEAGARLAEPGEFTLRAFLSGRIDLTQAEAVLGVIDALGENDLQASLAQLAGGLTRPMKTLREQLLQLLAELEAGLDFVEDDIRFVSQGELVGRLQTAAQLLDDIARQAASRMTDEAADQVVLIGPPNVGKSRVFNTLVDRYGLPARPEPSPAPALVSPTRGTTRDYLTRTIALDGAVCILVDTAGIENERPTTPPHSTTNQAPSIDTLAQAITAERRTQAAIRVWCSEISQPIAAPADCNLIVLTKADLRSQSPDLTCRVWGSLPVVITSSHTGAGLDELCSVLRRLVMRDSVDSAAPIVATTAHRCQASIRLAESSLRRAAHMAMIHGGDELVAMEIRDALAELGKVVGSVYTDDLLDRIFSSFCIGK
jgi:tRNA modification GTPase